MIGLVALLIAVAVAALFMGIYRYALLAQELGQRFDQVTALTPLATAEEGQRPRLRDRLERWLGKASFAGRTRARLSRANIKLTVAEFTLIRLGVTLVGFLAGWAISRLVVGGALVAILASSLPNWYVDRQQNKRLRAFQEQLPDVLSLLVSSMRAGHGLLQAVNLVTQEMPEPTAGEFGRVRREVNLGFSMSEALAHLVQRVKSDDLELVVTAVNIQQEVGGNLAETLDTISETIRDRVRLLGEIQTMTAQQRMTGKVLSGLPFLLGTVLMMINPDYMKGLFQPGLPMFIAGGAVLMVIMGYFLMQRMLHMDI
ncbi:MAG: type II secretion system F family protein [Chloroflexi bacterium]|nr:type II secretion system F family protein [Chloroflexota bacterium]